ncbi:MAG: hypothetical protein EOO65_03795 [Methanosarcinales archaeon]|nr:MAG: hypothetical protein EOO65_03795 [Methanosarcinales archaeon]
MAALTLSDDTPASLRRDSHTSVHSVVTDMSAAHAAAAIAAAPAAPLQTVPVSNSEAESASGGADGDVHATASTDGGANAEVATAAAAAAAAPPAIEAATETHTEAVPAEEEAEEGVETDVPWRATAAWWESVKRTLPLGTVLRCTAHLLPIVEEYVRESGNSADDVAVVAFVKQVELVGILPVPHPIVLRRYEPNEYTALWFTTFTWSSIFLSLATEDTPMFDVQAIRLFQLTVV